MRIRITHLGIRDLMHGPAGIQSPEEEEGFN